MEKLNAARTTEGRRQANQVICNGIIPVSLNDRRRVHRQRLSSAHHKVHGAPHSLRHALPDFRGRTGFA